MNSDSSSHIYQLSFSLISQASCNFKCQLTRDFHFSFCLFKKKKTNIMLQVVHQTRDMHVDDNNDFLNKKYSRAYFVIQEINYNPGKFILHQKERKHFSLRLNKNSYSSQTTLCKVWVEYISGSLTHCKSLGSVTLQKLYVHRKFLSILPGKIRVPGKRVTHIKRNPQILEAVITFRELGRNVALWENLIP